MRRALIAVVLVACVPAAIWAASSVIDGDADTSAVEGRPELTGLGTAPHLAVGIDPQPGERVLAEGRSWTLVITRRPALSLRRPRSASTVSDYTRPVTLNEASAFVVRRGGTVLTLVAGPVQEDGDEVVVETVRGGATDVRPLTAHGLEWFLAEVPGRAAISAIAAGAADGTVVDEYTLPPMPPDGPPTSHRVTAPPPPGRAP